MSVLPPVTSTAPPIVEFSPPPFPSPPTDSSSTSSPPAPSTTNGSSPVIQSPPDDNRSWGPSSGGGGGGLPRAALAGLIVGVVLGAVIVLIGVAFFVYCYRRQKRKDAEAFHGQHHPPNPPKSDNSQWHQNPASVGTFQKPSTPPPCVSSDCQPPPMNPSMEPPSSSCSLGSENPPGQMTSQVTGMELSQSTFMYEDLARATDRFSNMNLIGQGGFGYVHKGVLPNGRVVAVKQLKDGSRQGEREFQAEVHIISRVHHRHLVCLVGYCIAGSQRLLVYEFVPNKTLEYHLHEKGRPVMDWPTRLKIALGAARGLAYLHEDCQPKIIHRDIKASNILLDDSFEAKVADFGLAKSSLDTDTHVSTRIMGTFGYLAPEYAASGKLTDKSDVYSFGVVLLELITGRSPVDRSQPFADDSIVDWAKPLMTQALNDDNFEGLVDPRLEKNFDTSEMTRMVACAAASVRHSARRRPKMSQIVRALEGNMSIDELTDGVKPGHSTIYSIDGSSDYSSSQHKEDLQKFRKMALESQTYGSSEISVPTSEFGLNPSSSSTEAHQSTREIEMETKKTQEAENTIRDINISS